MKPSGKFSRSLFRDGRVEAKPYQSQLPDFRKDATIGAPRSRSGSESDGLIWTPTKTSEEGRDVFFSALAKRLFQLRRLESGVTWLFSAAFRIGLVVAAMATMVPSIVYAQTAGAGTERTPVAEETAVAPAIPTTNEREEGPTTNEREEGEDASEKTSPRPKIELEIERVIEIEIEGRFNELRGELLDERANVINFWLAVVAIVFALGGIFSIREFQRFRKTARLLVKEIKEKRDEAVVIVQEMTAETAATDPKRTDQAAERVLENPQASSMDKAIARAVFFQREGKIDEALNLWERVARIAEESNQALAARAWFSIGFLIHARNAADSIPAYDRAIRLNPQLAGPYTNRGNVMLELGRYKDASIEHTEAIRRDPSLAEAYNNRGAAKEMLEQYREAIEDYTLAIFLKPNLVKTYRNRGKCKAALGLKDEARVDFETALELARTAGEVELVAQLKQQLEGPE